MQAGKEIHLNVPISKVDEEQRMVWGIATTEAVDSQGDVVDYGASKSAFSSWLGNIREMHNPVAVGKAIDIQYDDKEKQVMIGAKISESADGQNAWTKVKEGVLTGFSIGGKINKIIADKVASADGERSVTRITDYVLSEVSLVDSPANPQAKLVMVKSIDGNLTRVEVEEDAKHPHAAPWWIQKFMVPMETAQTLYDKSMSKRSEVKKSMWDAAWLLDLAIDLSSYINMEQYEGESVDDLKAALAAIKAAVVQELNEPTEELTVAVELASKTLDLSKGGVSVVDGEPRDAVAAPTAETTTQAAKKIGAVAVKAPAPVKKSTNVVGGVERDEVAAVVEDNRPDNVKETDAPIVVESPVEEPKVEEAAVEETVEKPAKKSDEPEEILPTPGTEEVTPEAPAEEVVAEDKPSEEEAPVEVDKADAIANLQKSVDALMTKLDAPEQSSELRKASELVKEVKGSVDALQKSTDALQERVAKLEAQPMPKSKSSFVEITKGEEDQPEGQAEVQALLKRQEELLKDASEGTPQERMKVAEQLRKYQAQGIKLT